MMKGTSSVVGKRKKEREICSFFVFLSFRGLADGL